MWQQFYDHNFVAEVLSFEIKNNYLLVHFGIFECDY